MRKMIMVIGLSLLLVVPTHMDAKEVYFRHGSKDSGKARTEPTLKSKACLKCLYFTKIISALCCYLEYFSYLYTIN